MKRLIISVVAIIFAVLAFIGFRVDVKQEVWKQLSPKEREQVIGKWVFATVSKQTTPVEGNLLANYEKGTPLYKVTFLSENSVSWYADRTTRKIVGYEMDGREQ